MSTDCTWASCVILPSDSVTRSDPVTPAPASLLFVILAFWRNVSISAGVSVGTATLPWPASDDVARERATTTKIGERRNGSMERPPETVRMSRILREKLRLRVSDRMRRLQITKSQRLRKQALHQINVIRHHTEQVVAIEAQSAAIACRNAPPAE